MLELSLQTSFTTFCSRGTHYSTSSAATLLAKNINSSFLIEIQDIRELKQTDGRGGREKAVNKQISIQKDSRLSEFSWPLTSFTLELNRDLNVTASSRLPRQFA